MKNNLDWKESALCLKDKNSSHWLSYGIDHIEYAKKGCLSCKVQRECFSNAIMQESYVGVNAGISEWEFLIKTWKKVTNAKKTNWPNNPTALRRLLPKEK